MGNPDIQALNLGKMPGALSIPAMRKPTRGTLGGAAPRGARTRLPPTLGAAAGGPPKGKAAPAKKSAPKKRKSNV